MPKVHCPRHEDQFPSCEVYETSAYCFAGCGSIPLEELKLDSKVEIKEKYRENLKERREYIDKLPRQEVRGFTFPADEMGYYITWPDSDYYKCRLWNPPEKAAKYKNPSGHPQPPFRAQRGRGTTLILVEGEINALSVGKAFPEHDVISPGSASDFMAKKLDKDLWEFSQYAKVVIVVDRDAPGTAAAIHLKSKLMQKVPYVNIVLMQEDANQILVEKGVEALRDDLQKRL
jgi:hypothetical protein